MEALNYLDYEKLWNENGKDIIESVDEDNILLDQFRGDRDVEFMPDECEFNIEKKEVYMFFGEQGGQNESDTQGWSRDYTIILDAENLLFKDIEYTQG